MQADVIAQRSRNAVAQNPVEFRRFPYPYRAALAICSDLDETPDRDVYYECARFLNTTDDTSMGRGVGLEVGNTIYFEMPNDQFAYWNTDERGRAMVRALIRSGHIDCLHSFGDLAVTRASAARALEDLARHECRLEVWIDHATAASNLGGDIMQGSGDLPGSPVYHADLTCDAGVRFVWRGRVTSVIGQNAPRSLGGVWRGAHPLRSARTILKEATKGMLARRGHAKYSIHADNSLLRESELRDGHQVYEFLRFNPHYGGVSCGDRASGIPEVLTSRMLGRLIERRASAILYTHLGKIRSAREPFDRPTRDAFGTLAAMQNDGRILVTTTRRLLGLSAVQRRLEGVGRIDADHLRIDLRLKPGKVSLSRGDLAGTTIYVEDPHRTRVFVDGEEAAALQRNTPDETGRASVTIPWTRLSFPGRCL